MRDLEEIKEDFRNRMFIPTEEFIELYTKLGFRVERKTELVLRNFITEVNHYGPQDLKGQWKEADKELDKICHEIFDMISIPEPVFEYEKGYKQPRVFEVEKCGAGDCPWYGTKMSKSGITRMCGKDGFEIEILPGENFPRFCTLKERDAVGRAFMPMA